MDGCKYHTQGSARVEGRGRRGMSMRGSSAGMRKEAGLFFKASIRKGF